MGRGVNVGSLFSGIGGFDYGLERAGFTVAWQCEADDFCRRVLARHWPGVPCYPDVRELRAADVEPVDVLCGGFPCQDISLAGKGAGIDGARSGLWGEYARLVGELRPRYVIVENVAALLARGLGRVLGDLAALGYDAEWDCIPAAAVGAPHRRDRLWLVAYPSGARRREDAGGAPRDESPDEGWPSADDHLSERDGESRGARPMADPERGGRQGRQTHEGRGSTDREESERREGSGELAGRCEARGALADAQRERELQPQGAERQERRRAGDGSEQLADADAQARAGARGPAEEVSGPGTVERPGRRGGAGGDVQDADERAVLAWRVGGRAAQAGGSEWWATEPPVGRVAHGVPDRLDQLAALGNALVPQIAEWLGGRIIEWEGSVTL